jgi:hypothetical protein
VGWSRSQISFRGVAHGHGLAQSGRLNYRLIRTEIFSIPQLATKNKVFVSRTRGLLSRGKSPQICSPGDQCRSSQPIRSYIESDTLKFKALSTEIAYPSLLASIYKIGGHIEDMEVMEI